MDKTRNLVPIASVKPKPQKTQAELYHERRALTESILAETALLQARIAKASSQHYLATHFRRDMETGGLTPVKEYLSREDLVDQRLWMGLIRDSALISRDILKQEGSVETTNKVVIEGGLTQIKRKTGSDTT